MRAVAIVSIHVIMSNTEHPAGAAHRFFRCTFGPVREVDLVWPPPDAEIDAFSIVHLDDGDAQPPRVEAPPIEPPPAEPVRLEVVARAPRRIKPTFGDCRALGAAPRVRPLVVPMEPAPVPGPAVPDPPVVGLPPAIPEEARVAEMPADDITIAAAKAPPLVPIHLATLPSDPEAAGARRSAWLAVFFAAACALVTIAEYRGVVTWRSGAREAPPVPADVTVADVQAPQVDPVRPTAAPTPATAERAAAAAPASADSCADAEAGSRARADDARGGAGFRAAPPGRNPEARGRAGPSGRGERDRRGARSRHGHRRPTRWSRRPRRCRRRRSPSQQRPPDQNRSRRRLQLHRRRSPPCSPIPRATRTTSDRR